MVRYDIAPGHGRLRIVDHQNDAELVVGYSENVAKPGMVIDGKVDDIETLFSIVISDPKTARVYAKRFIQIAEMLEHNKEAD